MDRKQENRIIHVMLAVAVILSIGFLIGFLHGQEAGYWTGYKLKTDVVGQFGDFIGGVVGTIVSVVLLYFTLYHQRKDSQHNAKVFEKQQLNDDFYHLVDLYHQTLQAYELSEGEKKYVGKSALRKSLEKMKTQWDYSARCADRKQAVSRYLDFYAKQADFAPTYFRILYRLCETICDKEQQTGYKNVEYIKILRAQFSSPELVLLRCNAQTRMGAPFRHYINRFNLLKHLPPLEMMEYSRFCQGLSAEQVASLNHILVELRQHMADVLDPDKRESYSMVEYRSNVTITIQVSALRDMLTLAVHRNTVDTQPSFDLYHSVMILSEDILKKLFGYFLYESLVLFNFQEFNQRRELEFTSDTQTQLTKNVYTFTVTNKLHHALNMTWKQYQRSLI